MSPIAFLKDLLSRGMPLDMAIEAAEAFEAQVALSAADLLETRRRKDRERKRAAKAVPQNSADSVEKVESAETLSPSPSPQTPQPRPHTRGDIYTPRAKAGPSGAEIAKGFLAFWEAYPRKKSKDAAAKAFERAMKRIPDPDPLAVILAGIERALPGWDDRTFIPYPASWLNAGGWEDEPPTPRTSAERPRHDRPDKLQSKLDNLDRGFRAAERAADFVAANRTF